MGTANFASLFNTGARMTHIRGVRPSVCMMKVNVQPGLTGKQGTLTFTDDEFGAFSFPNCAVRENSYVPTTSRQAARYDLKIEDRRWKWRYPKINGLYNRRARNGTIQTTNKKTARELATILFTALGDASADVSAVPEDTYPTVYWHGARAALELEWLLDLFGLTVSLNLDNSITVVPLLAGGTDSGLPAAGIISAPLEHDWKITTIPDTIEVLGGPTLIQSGLTLTNVRDEYTGSWSISAGNWPLWMSGVASTERDQAFISGLRHFYPTAGWNGDGETINDFRQLELLPFMLESDSIGANPEIMPRKPVIVGDFWIQDEMGTNGTDEVFTGEFWFHPDGYTIETDRPLFKVDGDGTITVPTLKLYTAYRVRKADGTGYVSYSKDVSVVGAPAATEARTENHPELVKAKIVDSPWGASAGDNETDLDTEADSYLNNLKAVYEYNTSTMGFYGGLRNQDTDGEVSQVMWVCGEYGRGGGSYTLMSSRCEADVATAHERQRRALGRVEQMYVRAQL